MGARLQLNKNGNNNLNEKIDYLREAAIALVAEVKSLDLPAKVEFNENINFDEEVKRFEINLIEHALDRTGGNQLKAARLLNLKHTTLNNKIKRYQISLTSKRAGSINAYSHVR